MYFHHKRSGLIAPLPFYLVWKAKIPLALMGLGLYIASPIASFLSPLTLKPVDSQKAAQDDGKAFRAYQIKSCSYVTQPKDIAFCKTLKAGR